ncbi:MarR family winged helix-turn-helix transcriptional regulator [Nocardiopsis sp. NRRL B-16309]|uniref:MarR family winged helix-turn-helix transcriptional regulator n=1 Tax=Nocardiopsis sp. NRRL B-16309 TaxID=1519494 RepID=UPI0006AE4F2F|nr:MarR family transcriptional regulator [Nocardiopsis sp. NRRL B-16309]KOX14043.1 MarR family transcriptional regulator [Nocardiopsis sp. NRRL B-16309]
MADTRWLSDSEQETWRTFMAAVRLMESALDRQLRRDSGLPHAYFHALVVLSEAPDREMTMSALAERLLSSPSRLSHAVSRMESDGLVRRYKRPGDRRTTIAALTEAGLAALREAAPGHVDEVRRVVFDPLTEEQVDRLREISAAMLGALGAESSTPWNA